MLTYSFKAFRHPPINSIIFIFFNCCIAINILRSSSSVKLYPNIFLTCSNEKTVSWNSWITILTNPLKTPILYVTNFIQVGVDNKLGTSTNHSPEEFIRKSTYGLSLYRYNSLSYRGYPLFETILLIPLNTSSASGRLRTGKERALSMPKAFSISDLLARYLSSKADFSQKSNPVILSPKYGFFLR